MGVAQRKTYKKMTLQKDKKENEDESASIWNRTFDIRRD